MFYARCSNLELWLPLALLIVPGIASAAEPEKEAKPNDKRDVVGEVLGKPVYREDLQASGERLADVLHQVFSRPVSQKYWAAHQKDVEPTDAEIELMTRFMVAQHAERMKEERPKIEQELAEIAAKLVDPNLPADERTKLELQQQVKEIQLKPPGREVAQIMLPQWKQQRYLYDQFGGGRVLFQQFGLEAFDATRKWLEAEEKAGEFKITDKKLRDEFYKYWTTQNHGSFLMDDKEKIRDTFLEPEWMGKK